MSADQNSNPAFPISTKRHSAAHLMACAIQRLFPGTQFGVGPDIKNGFYYDVLLPDGRQLQKEDIKKISDEMKQLRKKNLPFTLQMLPIDDAIAMMEKANQPFKVELLQMLKQRGSTAVDEEFDESMLGAEIGTTIKEVSIYQVDEFFDLCRGPHVDSSRQIPVFELTEVAAAYWRGDAGNPVMQRVYALCFDSKEELQAEKQRIEEARRRDHRRLGKQHELFFISSEDYGAGLPFWLPNGAVLRDEVQYLAREEERRLGYQQVYTPELAKESVYQRSGHLTHYADDMYQAIEIEKERYRLRPMNCPHHHEIYRHQKHSYRDLPLRLAEYGQVYRYEVSGALSGLMRARGFVQNDAHIYCREDQVIDVFLEVMHMHDRYYQLFGMKNYYMRLSLPDDKNLEKYVEDAAGWRKACELLQEAMRRSNLPFVEGKGEAAFYGPKIDFQAENAVGIEYTISTNQLDFLATSRFDLTYTASDGSEQPVYVIHRAPLGSHERFVAFLIEHYEAKFPTWLAPEQARLIPVSEPSMSYAREVCDILRQERVHNGTGGLRIGLDDSSNTIQKRIRTAQQARVPYLLVVGEKEMAERSVAVRMRNNRVENMSIEQFLRRIKQEAESRKDVELEAAVEYNAAKS